jgi:hypothetical protein
MLVQFGVKRSGKTSHLYRLSQHKTESKGDRQEILCQSLMFQVSVFPLPFNVSLFPRSWEKETLPKHIK